MDDTSLPGRSVDIELGGQEVITIDLDNLDPNPDDVRDLVKEGKCTIYVWTKLAGEYWRRGYLEAAERIALTAIECTFNVLRAEGTSTDVKLKPFKPMNPVLLYHQFTLSLPTSRLHMLGRRLN
jgi:hypothetical protein